MGKYRRFVIASFIGLAAQKNYGQKDFALLEKNNNYRANGLYHELNKTKDTLILKGDKKITYVYSINNEYKREIDTYAGTNEFKVSLKHLSKGKHMFVVDQSPLKIIFVIKILHDRPKPISDGDLKITAIESKKD